MLECISSRFNPCIDIKWNEKSKEGRKEKLKKVQKLLEIVARFGELGELVSKRKIILLFERYQNETQEKNIIVKSNFICIQSIRDLFFKKEKC